MIDQVARRAQVDAGQVIWHSVVFTVDPAYVPPRTGNDTRWTILATADGQLAPRSREMLFVVIPHEQVHAVQSTMHPRLPRWFTEGHATWLGLQISDLVMPEAAAAERRRHAEAFQAIGAPLNLAAWGGVRPRREAIYRQVSPEDQARMDRDPTFTPSGSFQFRVDDFMPDQVDQPPRYAASYRLFEELGRQAGARRMAAWQRAIWADAGPVDTQRLTALAGEHLKQNLRDRLR
jgi:hypothetical protein